MWQKNANLRKATCASFRVKPPFQSDKTSYSRMTINENSMFIRLRVVGCLEEWHSKSYDIWNNWSNRLRLRILHFVRNCLFVFPRPTTTQVISQQTMIHIGWVFRVHGSCHHAAPYILRYSMKPNSAPVVTCQRRFIYALATSTTAPPRWASHPEQWHPLWQSLHWHRTTSVTSRYSTSHYTNDIPHQRHPNTVTPTMTTTSHCSDIPLHQRHPTTATSHYITDIPLHQRHPTTVTYHYISDIPLRWHLTTSATSHYISDIPLQWRPITSATSHCNDFPLWQPHPTTSATSHYSDIPLHQPYPTTVTSHNGDIPLQVKTTWN